MQIITLTTDMGTKDHYVAALKATILSKIPDVHIIDISHAVRPFDISEAAYHVRSCYEDFPEGTIHIVGVDSEPVINFGGADGSFPSVLEDSGQYFRRSIRMARECNKSVMLVCIHQLCQYGHRAALPVSNRIKYVTAAILVDQTLESLI